MMRKMTSKPGVVGAIGSPKPKQIGGRRGGATRGNAGHAKRHNEGGIHGTGKAVRGVVGGTHDVGNAVRGEEKDVYDTGGHTVRSQEGAHSMGNEIDDTIMGYSGNEASDAIMGWSGNLVDPLVMGVSTNIRKRGDTSWMSGDANCELDDASCMLGSARGVLSRANYVPGGLCTTNGALGNGPCCKLGAGRGGPNEGKIDLGTETPLSEEPRANGRGYRKKPSIAF
ncbi:unnamed protein product [Ilex paraguariensis]|uniref:Uncharacterized protein n=1 Tax=Ilex paraguariensis TaxID=185542 RepID=A0ABC8SVE8_9AQUA